MTRGTPIDVGPGSTFNQNLIRGLWLCRNTRPELRGWLRQCIRYERKRTGRS